jgi:hypothetical protein
MVDAGCNLWRNWEDIDNSWDSVREIIAHWADYQVRLSRRELTQELATYSSID